MSSKSVELILSCLRMPSTRDRSNVTVLLPKSVKGRPPMADRASFHVNHQIGLDLIETGSS